MEVYQHQENLCFFGFVELSMAVSIEEMKWLLWIFLNIIIIPNPENLEIQMALVNVITHKGNRGR